MPNPDYDPLDALVQRSASGLRQAVVLEQAILTGATRQTGVAATMAAARKALALKRAAEPAAPRPIPLRDGLLARAATAVPVEPAPAAMAAGPRRTRAPSATGNLSARRNPG